MHQSVNNVLRTLVHTNPPWNMTHARDIKDNALATAMHAMWTTIATTLGSLPGALAFARDMFLNVPLIADWQAIAHTHEHHVNENLRHANRKRHQFDYAPGQQVLKKVHNSTMLGVRMEVLTPLNAFMSMVTWLYYCVKGLLSASTYAGFYCIVDHSTYPCEDIS